MESKKTNWIWGISLAVLGIVMLASPSFMVKLVVFLLGLLCVVRAIYNLVRVGKDSENEIFNKMVVGKSVAGIFFGVMAMIFSLPFAVAAWSVLVYVFAIYLLVAAVFGFYTLSFIRKENVDRKEAIFENSLMCVAAILIFILKPVSVANVLLRIIGVVALLAGLAFIAFEVIALVRKNKNEITVEDGDYVVKDDDSTEESDEKSDSEGDK
jgi:uncharacterized membrane protein HdeD (DUF308 family)